MIIKELCRCLRVKIHSFYIRSSESIRYMIINWSVSIRTKGFSGTDPIDHQIQFLLKENREKQRNRRAPFDIKRPEKIQKHGEKFNEKLFFLYERICWLIHRLEGSLSVWSEKCKMIFFFLSRNDPLVFCLVLPFDP